MDVPPKTAPRLFLIDAYALIYRAYYAFISRPLTNSAGENTSAPFGFTRFLLDIRRDFEPDYIAIVFDSGDSFRDEIYPEYKETREKMPDDLRASLKHIRTIVEGFNDPVVELEGYEADDVIGTLAIQARDAGLEAVIVSGDKDFYQLVQPGIHLMNPGRGGAQGVAAEWVTEENADEKFGIPPRQVADYLALVGDSSDNVPGARGIGPKTAVKLLAQHPDIETLLEHVDDVSPTRAQNSLRDNADDVRLSKKLVTIMTDLGIDLDLDALKVQEPDAEALRDVFVQLEFRRLADEFAELAQGGALGTAAIDEGEAEVEYRVLDTPGALDDVVAAIRDAGRLSMAVAPSTADPLRGSPVGLALSVERGAAWYLPLGHEQPFELTFEGEESGEVRNLPAFSSGAMAGLKSVLEDAEVAKIGHDLKRSALALSTVGVTLDGLDFDVMIASYVLDPGRRDHELKTLSMEIFGHKPLERADVVGTGRSKVALVEVPVERARDFLCEAVDM
ncbi:MAG: 5'-3' exonuclease H3TH domain-containing protein, partial [Longimicrobiales bacterium]|nr:5'-3' exonuclease H3TH domain-containing protein [Longimicrobiales bacterium]